MPGNQGSNHLESATSIDLSALSLNPRVTRRGFMAVAAATATTAWLAACPGTHAGYKTGRDGKSLQLAILC